MQKGRAHARMNTHATAVREKKALCRRGLAVPIRSPCLSAWSPVFPSACLFMTRCRIDGLLTVTENSSLRASMEKRCCGAPRHLTRRSKS